MSTRHKRHSRLGQLAVPALCALLVSYFVHHAMGDRFGTQAFEDMEEEIRRLEFDLAGIRLERTELEERVLLLHDGTLEADMLDEKARELLNLLAEDEISLERHPATRRGGD